MVDQTDSVLFDLDCTLIDRHASIRRYMEQHFLPHFGVRTESDERTVLSVLIEADGVGYRAAKRPGDIVTGLQWTRETPSVDSVDAHWRAHFPSCSVAAPSAETVLEHLNQSGVALGLITNGSGESQRRKVADLGIEGYFSALVISEEAGCKKPDPRIFRGALDVLGVDASASWYVGDHPVNDIIGAASVGMRPVWVEGWHPWPADASKPTWSITGLDQLTEILDLASSAR